LSCRCRRRHPPFGFAEEEECSSFPSLPLSFVGHFRFSSFTSPDIAKLERWQIDDNSPAAAEVPANLQRHKTSVKNKIHQYIVT
jgi:hypothetical protein